MPNFMKVFLQELKSLELLIKMRYPMVTANSHDPSMT